MADSPRLEELRRRVQADPASIAFAALAEEYRRAGKFREAVEASRAGLRYHPTYVSARVTLGRSLVELQEVEQAERELVFVLKSAPDNLAARRALGELCWQQLRFSDALTHFRTAHTLAPSDTELPQILQSLERELAADRNGASGANGANGKAAEHIPEERKADDHRPAEPEPAKPAPALALETKPEPEPAKPLAAEPAATESAAFVVLTNADTVAELAPASEAAVPTQSLAIDTDRRDAEALATADTAVWDVSAFAPTAEPTPATEAAAATESLVFDTDRHDAPAASDTDSLATADTAVLHVSSFAPIEESTPAIEAPAPAESLAIDIDRHDAPAPSDFDSLATADTAVLHVSAFAPVEESAPAIEVVAPSESLVDEAGAAALTEVAVRSDAEVLAEIDARLADHNQIVEAPAADTQVAEFAVVETDEQVEEAAPASSVVEESIFVAHGDDTEFAEFEPVSFVEHDEHEPVVVVQAPVVVPRRENPALVRLERFHRAILVSRARRRTQAESRDSVGHGF